DVAAMQRDEAPAKTPIESSTSPRRSGTIRLLPLTVRPLFPPPRIGGTGPDRPSADFGARAKARHRAAALPNTPCPASTGIPCGCLCPGATEQGVPDEAGLDPLAGLADVTAGRRLAVPEHHAVRSEEHTS